MNQPQRPEVAIYQIDSSATQSMHALMLAGQELGLLSYLIPVDMRNDDIQVPAAIKFIWPDTDMTDTDDVNAKRDRLPDQDKPLTQRGQYYLVAIDTEAGDRLPVLIPEGHVVPFVFALAARAGRESALRVLYRHGILPTA